MSELQHPDARAFEHVAELYERVRPEYPEEAIRWLIDRLGLAARSTVLDLGAGTGKLTRVLVPQVGRVIAVEPGPEMLAQLERAVPDAEPVLGGAEEIPLADDSVDAVVCAQSFHWFRPDEALAEIHRVLRRGGGFGLIWNHRDPADDFQQEVRALLDPVVPAGRPAVTASVSHVEASASFGDVERAEFTFGVDLDADGVVARIFSISFVAAAEQEARRRLEDGLRTAVAARGDVVAFRYRTEAFVTFAV